MKEPIQVISHSAMPSLTKMPQALLTDMKEPKSFINQSVAPSVTTNVYYQTIKRHERTHIGNFDLVEKFSIVKASGWLAELWTVRSVTLT